MFGTYRTLLALGVVAMHLGGVPFLGNYSVFGFYVLSGYLMTLIVQTNYGYTASGISRYALNRILRIYPTYWAAVIMALILIFLLGETTSTVFHDAIFLPTNLIETLKNVFLVFAHDDRPRMVPPAWALSIELVFYAAIGLGLSRSKFISCIWLAVSVGYHAVAVYLGFSFGERYFPVYAASLPFATGAVIFHFQSKLTAIFSLRNASVDQYLPGFVFAALLANWFAGYILHEFRGVPFYLNFLLCALMVVLLRTRALLPAIPKSFDQVAGDLSYPIYLIHLQAGMIVFTGLVYGGINLGRTGPLILIASTPLVFLMAWALTAAVEKPTDKIREIIKRANTPVGAGAAGKK
jgi:peptidoglycan/LPS O-acetylase OafA/YrhL